MPTFQVFGMRCSGTNYLQALLEKNFEDCIRDMRYGWKHGGFGFPSKTVDPDPVKRHYRESLEPRSAPKDHFFLVIYRDPFAWLQSLHRSPHHAPFMVGLEFSQFIRMRWDSYPNIDMRGQDFAKDRKVRYAVGIVDNSLERFDSVFELRRVKSYRFHRMPDRASNFAYVNYECLAEQPEFVLRTIGEFFGLTMKGFENIEHGKHKSGKYVRKPLDDMLANDLDYICEELHFYSEARMGYRVDVSGLRALVARKGKVTSSELMSCVDVERKLLLKRDLHDPFTTVDIPAA